MELQGISLCGTIRKVEASSVEAAIEAFKVFTNKLGIIEKVNASINPPFKNWEISLTEEDELYYYLQLDYIKEEGDIT